MDFPGGAAEKKRLANETQETWVRFLGREDPLEEEMATHSSILAWECRGRRSLRAIVHVVTKSWTRLNEHTQYTGALSLN